MTTSYDKQAELEKINKNYSAVAPFIEKHKQMSYIQLDYAVVHEITLFTIEPELDFDELERKIDAVIGALPSIKHIFAQPFIHLKEQDVILPVEAVRIINNNTIRHISSHSELWSDVKPTEIKPSKLLTRTYEDNYGIYENLVFCKTIDDILAFVRINLRYFRELIYTNQTIEINLLERLNHLNYFLALGKLHTGYSRNFDSYYGVSMRCLNKLQYVANTIIPRLKRPVYKRNKVRPAQIKLRKTNILSMDKNYHQIYKLAKRFASSDQQYTPLTTADTESLQKNYFSFCELLCIFAIGHFNFTCDENKPINFSRLNMDFAFKDWKLKLKKEKLKTAYALTIEVKKDGKYKIALIPNVDEDYSNALLEAKNAIDADEYVVCAPFEDEDCGRVTVDVTSIESFRRIQQFVLRAMVCSDEKREECPFCQNKLILNTEKSAEGLPVYECPSCRTEIGSAFCPTISQTYTYTRIANFKKPIASNDDEWLAKRKLEAQMYFRNITQLNEDAEVICPHCGKSHAGK